MPNAISQKLVTLNIGAGNEEGEKNKTFGTQARKVKKAPRQAQAPILAFSKKLPEKTHTTRFLRQLSDPNPKTSHAESRPTYHSLQLPNAVLSLSYNISPCSSLTEASSGANVFSDSLTLLKQGQCRPQKPCIVTTTLDLDDGFKAMNEHLEWDEVSEIAMGEKTVGNCFFRYAEPTKELLPANTLLYKFSNYDSLPDKRDVSPWWSSVLERQEDSGLKNRLLLAQHLKVNPLEWGRVTSVIKENWSTLEYVIFIETTTPIYGWMGGFSAFKRIDTGKKSKRDTVLEPKGSSPFLPGGARQLFIPNLQKDHIKLIKVKNTMEIHPAESIFDNSEL